ncbi:helix-turn-helix domain-containing protein [Phycicoccus sp.]|uniref:helix-turn-helix transcriptional regulator n=1 Tax=Phycicoccus sp. TaxID=1902410 RepID=UPI002CE5CFAC|nr:helix-turn-helix domain-containing protein [Phycicoccus sp.]HMM94986.1 helix-turn-helix domain-containing protein [Phycicoccus sp.]
MPTKQEYDAAALLASPVRRFLVQLLEASATDSPQGLAAAEIAPQADLHVTTVRFHLDQLVAAGVLEAEFVRPGTAGRPRKVYRRAPARSAPGTEPLKLLTTLLTEAMTASVHGERLTPYEAGRRWAREHLADHSERTPADSAGAWLGRVGEVIDVLEDWGYQPEVSTSDGGRSVRVELTDCPFLDLARDNQAVVCGVHRGLIAESMAMSGEVRAHVALEPFVTETRCRALIRTDTPFKSS